MFPKLMPYCNVDLIPPWDYDLKKAIVLSCNSDDDTAEETSNRDVQVEENIASSGSNSKDKIISSSNALVIGLEVGLSIAGLVALFTVV